MESRCIVMFTWRTDVRQCVRGINIVMVLINSVGKLGQTGYYAIFVIAPATAKLLL